MSNTDDRPEPEPVSLWENNEVGGHALISEKLFQDHIQQAQALRDHHAAYIESLPTDPHEAISAALKLLKPGYDERPEGLEEARHLSWALLALVKEGDLDEQGCTRDAAIHIAQTIAFRLHDVTQTLDRVCYTLGKPSRSADEAQQTETVRRVQV